MNTTDLAETLRRLADDIEAIGRGEAPTAADLAAAPFLFDWEPTVAGVLALTGSVQGHPRLGDAPDICTTGLFALAPDLSWVRTQNRYYRLGPRARVLGEAGHA